MRARGVLSIFLLAVSAFAWAEPVKRLPAATKRWALIIGINKYRDSQLTGLSQAENDADKLAAALIRYASFPDDQVIVLATNKGEMRQPTRGNILRLLSNLSRLVPEDGLFLVSFSGHGIERKGEAFLLPADAQMSDNIRLLQDTAISVESMQSWIEDTHAGQVIVLLDACRNDPTAGKSASPNPLTPAYTNALTFELRNEGVQAFATIYATNVGARAYEYTDQKQGYFTWAVVQGLAGKAAVNGSVTLGSLIRYVQTVVPKQVQIDLGYEQKPFSVLKGYLADDLILSMIDRPGGTPQPVVQQDPPQNRPPDVTTPRSVEPLPEGVTRTPDNMLQPAPGWEWIKPKDLADKTVRLKPGYQRGSTRNSVVPTGGWEWTNAGGGSTNFDVRVKEGLRQASDDPYKLEPAVGWTWAYPKDSNNFEVRLKEGYARGAARGEIRPAQGWEWVAPKDPKNFAVRRKKTFHLPDYETNVAGIRLYESAYESVPYEKRQYQTVFSSATTRYVNVELHFQREKDGMVANAPVPCTFYRPDNTVMGDADVEMKMPADWKGGYFAKGLGWSAAGSWNPGTYRVSCRYNGAEVATATFQVKAPDVAYHFPALETNVTQVRLYEGPYDGVAVAARKYQLTFSAATARYVWIELKANREKAGEAVGADVPCTYYRPDGSVVGVATIAVKLQAGWQGSYSVAGLGWTTPGNWPSGTYRFSCRFNGNEVANGSFEMR